MANEGYREPSEFLGGLVVCQQTHHTQEVIQVFI